MLAVAVLPTLAGPAPPAAAHTVSGGGGEDFTAVLGQLTPPTPGVTLAAVENGSRLQLRNGTGEQVIVLGYYDEPYLRVGPDGTFENTLSPSTYVNRDRYGGQSGGTIDATSLPPQWRRTGDGPTLFWHDHRAHYMGGPYPPAVQARPRVRQVVQSSVVMLRVGDRPVTATLDRVYVPPPPSWPWWVLLGGLALGTALLGLPRRGVALLAAATAGLVVSDAVHSIGIGLTKAGTTGERLAAFAGGNAAEAVAWLVGGVGVVLLLRKGVAGAYCAGTAAAVVAVVGGYGDVGTLASSTAPFAGPLAWARLLTVVAMGVGAGLLVGCALLVRRLDREESLALAGGRVPERQAGQRGRGPAGAPPPPHRPRTSTVITRHDHRGGGMPHQPPGPPQ